MLAFRLREAIAPMTLLLGAALALPATVNAHGTADPGPHGGEIRMPGAFHVEALAGEQAFRVYVLDMQFDNPTVENASLTAKLEQGGTTKQLDCKTADDAAAFVCPLPANATLEQGVLTVDAERSGKPGEPAKYELPLEWSDE